MRSLPVSDRSLSPSAATWFSYSCRLQKHPCRVISRPAESFKMFYDPFSKLQSWSCWFSLVLRFEFGSSWISAIRFVPSRIWAEFAEKSSITNLVLGLALGWGIWVWEVTNPKYFNKFGCWTEQGPIQATVVVTQLCHKQIKLIQIFIQRNRKLQLKNRYLLVLFFLFSGDLINEYHSHLYH